MRRRSVASHRVSEVVSSLRFEPTRAVKVRTAALFLIMIALSLWLAFTADSVITGALLGAVLVALFLWFWWESVHVSVLLTPSTIEVTQGRTAATIELDTVRFVERGWRGSLCGIWHSSHPIHVPRDASHAEIVRQLNEYGARCLRVRGVGGAANRELRQAIAEMAQARSIPINL